MKHQNVLMMRFLFLLSIASVCFSSCKKEDNRPPNQVQELFWVKDQGTEMPVLVSGNKNSDKIILVIVGGPGGSSIDVAHYFFKQDMERDVLMAYWDQRMSGLSINTTIPTSISFAQYALDCKKVVEKLKQKFPDKKIVIWGQSWGGLVVSQFITEANYQSLYDGWIIVNGISTNGFDEFKYLREGLIQRATNLAKNGQQQWADSLIWMNALPFNPLVYEEDLELRYLRLVPDLWEQEPEIKDLGFQNNVPPFFTQQDKERIMENALNQVNENPELSERIYKYNRDAQIGNIAKKGLLIWGEIDSTIPLGVATSFKSKLGDKASLLTYPNDSHTPWATELNRKNHARDVLNFIKTL